MNVNTIHNVSDMTVHPIEYGGESLLDKEPWYRQRIDIRSESGVDTEFWFFFSREVNRRLAKEEGRGQ